MALLETPSVLAEAGFAEATNVVSDRLRLYLKRLSSALQPEAETLQTRFLRRLEKLGFNAMQRTSLAQLTLGAGVRLLQAGRLPGFFEQIEYNGRRLAKLHVPPGGVASALAEYDNLLTATLRHRLSAADQENLPWARQQLQFSVMLTLNNAYYQVREAEARAYSELFHAELESNHLDELLERLMKILARFCRADAACLVLDSPETGGPVRRVTLQGEQVTRGSAAGAHPRFARALANPRHFQIRPGGSPALLEQSWRGRYASCWSVPMKAEGRIAGVMQFAFVKHYDWMPREQELLTTAAERCLVAAKKARLVEDLASSEEQIRRLAEHMLHVEEAERRRVSRELHDQTGQDLLCIRLKLELMEQSVGGRDPEWKDRLGEVRDLTERTIMEVRRLIGALSPAVLEQLGLAAALRQLAYRLRQMHQCKVRLQIGKLANLPKRLEIIVYRLVQECVSNIVKHSQATHVNICVSSADGSLRLQVEDDGVGFDVEEALGRRDTFGLSGIRERVALLGGELEIASKVRKEGSPRSAGRGAVGARIDVELPIQGPAHQELAKVG